MNTCWRKKKSFPPTAWNVTTLDDESLQPEHQSLFEFGKLLACEKKLEALGYNFKQYPKVENEKERVTPLFHRQ